MGYINFNEEFKDRGVKLIVRVLAIAVLLIIIALSIITFKKISDKEHVKFLGFEFNIPDPENTNSKQKEQPKRDSQTNKLDVPISKPVPSVNKSMDFTSKKQKSIDTLVKAKVEQPIIQAKNVNTGTNLGQVGDNYISNEKQLTDPDKIDLLNFIETVKKKYNFNPTCINMSSTPNSNGGKIAAQIADFLIGKGYTLEGSGISFPSGGTMKGIAIDKMGDCLSITVGTL
jgi:hypothetical protein